MKQKYKQIWKFIPKGKSFSRITQEHCNLIALFINVETHLQNPKKYSLGKTITNKEVIGIKMM